MSSLRSCVADSLGVSVGSVFGDTRSTKSVGAGVALTVWLRGGLVSGLALGDGPTVLLGDGVAALALGLGTRVCDGLTLGLRVGIFDGLSLGLGAGVFVGVTTGRFSGL